MRVYLDCCVLGRLFDDQSADRIREETESVETILDLIDSGEIEFISSSVLELETQRNPSEDARAAITALLQLAASTVHPLDKEFHFASSLVELGFGNMDALHLACAATAGVDVFLTVDYRLIRKADWCVDPRLPTVRQPTQWLATYLRGGQT